MHSVLDYPEIRQRVSLLSVEQYQNFTHKGLMAKNTELIEGVVIEKMSKSPMHRYATEKLAEILALIFSQTFYVSEEKPLALERSVPEPDIAVLKGTKEDYRFEHPHTAHFVVEICYSSYQFDFEKQFIYAEAKIPEYWLVNLDKGETEVYRMPQNGQYRERMIYRKDQAIPIESQFVTLEMIFPEVPT